MRDLIITLLTFLILGACSNEESYTSSNNEESLNKKIIMLESEVERYRDQFYKVYGNIVESCTTYEEDISTLGPYTLIQTTSDQDWDCINQLSGYETFTGEGFLKDGVTDVIVNSPTKQVFRSVRETKVQDIEEFYLLSYFTGGAWCCTVDVFLSKEPPYEAVFTEQSYGDSSVVWKDFDDDGEKEIEVIDTNFIHWRASTAGSALPAIYLEYYYDSFRLSKELTYIKALEKMQNTDPERFIFHERVNDLSEGLSGWQGHDIPSSLIEVIAPLIMARREDEARKFLNEKWPDHLTDKELFLSLLKEQVEQSQYW
tara:strand:- start:575 stop:1516 length:942 start_codon:yes stop_codon:yes gene_type:complete